MATIRKVTNKNSITYRVEVRLKGYPPQRATFKRKTDASRWAKSVESAILENRFFKSTESRKHTLADLIDRYIKSVLPKKKDHKRLKTQYEWWKKELGDYALCDVTPALLSEKRDKLGEDKAPATVVRYLAALSHAYTIAVNDWGWLDDNPMRKVTKPKEPEGIVRFLSDDVILDNGDKIEGERTRLLKACKASKNKHLYTIVVLALSTGMRQDEIMTLSWKVVDLTRKCVTLYDTKNKKIRSVPLTGKAYELVKELSKVRRLETDLLFPGRNPKKPLHIRHPWRKAVTTACVEDFRFHDLRHSAASYLAMNGATLLEIADILGHKTLEMVKRYAHLSIEHKSGVVASMNDKIFG